MAKKKEDGKRIEFIKLEAIRIDGDTQPRQKIDVDAVAEYAEAIEADVELPPPDCIFDGSDYWLWDGFHRVHAHRKVGNTMLHVRVTDGTVADAQWLCLAANQTHGIRRTNADKRRAVEQAISRKPDHSNGAIASHCGVSDRFVATVRAELTPNGSESKSDPTPNRSESHTKNSSLVTPNRSESKPQNVRIGKDGRATDVSNIGRKSGAVADEIGLPVPAELVEVFATRKQFDDLAQRLRNINRDVAALAALPAGAALDAHLGHRDGKVDGEAAVVAYCEHVKSAELKIKWARPYASVCPYCFRTGSGLRTECGACQGRGWVTQGSWENCPEDDREAARLDRLDGIEDEGGGE